MIPAWIPGEKCIQATFKPGELVVIKPARQMQGEPYLFDYIERDSLVSGT